MSSSTDSALSPFDLSLDLARVDPRVSPAIHAQILELFDECAPALRRYVRASGVAPDAADDIVQEAFLALFRHLRAGGSQVNLRGWLFTVSHRLALKQRAAVGRAQQRHATLDADVASGLSDPAVGPEARLSLRQDRQRMRSVINALPPRDRQCLYLRAEGLRYRDIAAVLEMSLGAVAKSLARTILRLSNAMGGTVERAEKAERVESERVRSERLER